MPEATPSNDALSVVLLGCRHTPLSDSKGLCWGVSSASSHLAFVETLLPASCGLNHSDGGIWDRVVCIDLSVGTGVMELNQRVTQLNVMMS